MTIQQFIDKAIEGGWKPWKYGWPSNETRNESWYFSGRQLHLNCEVKDYDAYPKHEGPWHSSKEFVVDVERVLLDPKAWKAVGKVEGWYAGEHTQKAQDMIYALFAEKKTIEQYLKTL